MPVWQRDNRRAGRGAGSKPGRAAGLRLRVRMAEANGRHDSFRDSFHDSAVRSRGAGVPQPSPRKPEASAFGDKRRDESFRPEGPRHVLSTARSARGRVSTGPLRPRGGLGLRRPDRAQGEKGGRDWGPTPVADLRLLGSHETRHGAERVPVRADASRRPSRCLGSASSMSRNQWAIA